MADEISIDRIPIAFSLVLPVGSGAQMSFQTQFLRGEDKEVVYEAINRLEEVATRFVMRGKIPELEERIAQLRTRLVTQQQSLGRLEAQKTTTRAESEERKEAIRQTTTNLEAVELEAKRLTEQLAALYELTGAPRAPNGVSDH